MEYISRYVIPLPANVVFDANCLICHFRNAHGGSCPHVHPPYWCDPRQAPQSRLPSPYRTRRDWSSRGEQRICKDAVAAPSILLCGTARCRQRTEIRRRERCCCRIRSMVYLKRRFILPFLCSSQSLFISSVPSFLRQPDLPLRLKYGIDLAPFDPKTFYAHGTDKFEGYSDYPFSDKVPATEVTSAKVEELQKQENPELTVQQSARSSHKRTVSRLSGVFNLLSVRK